VRNVTERIVRVVGDKLILVSDVPVSVNAYLKPRAFLMNIKGKMQAQVTIYETSEAKAYKKKFITYAKSEIKKQNWTYQKGKFVVVKAIIYFDKTNRDANNIWKLMLDSLTESGVWDDDNVVMERAERIYYDAKNPRVELEIYHYPGFGVFNNEIEYNNFLNVCVGCSRYKNNCSILAKALESRIQEEISLDKDGNNICGKFKKAKVDKKDK